MFRFLSSRLFALAAFLLVLAGSFFAAPTFALFNNTGGAGFNMSDNWFSDWDDTMRVSVNITSSSSATLDPITNVTLIITNSSGSVLGTFNMSPIAPNATSNTTHANGTGIWNITLSLSAAIHQFNRTGQTGNISTPQAWFVQVNATDNETTGATYLGKVISGGPPQRAILVHNLGDTQGPPANATINGVNVSQCVRETSTTTNMSRILNFEAVNFIMEMQMYGNSTCAAMFGMNSTPWGNTWQTTGRVNFTSVNLSTQEQASAVMSAMGNAVRLQISPPHTYQPSRIYINGSAVSALNTTAQVTFNYLPFSSVPNITHDETGDTNGVTVVANATWYDANNRTTFMNLTLQIANFSGYNISDEIAPHIQMHAPLNLNGTNYSSGLINFTVNGTGTEVKNITFRITNSTGSTMALYYFAYNGTHATQNGTNCTPFNTNIGYETLNCTLRNITLPAQHGNYTLSIAAYDFGGTAGNSRTALTYFMNNTGPALTVNVTYVNASYNHSVFVNVTATDANGGQDINFTNITLSDAENISCTFLSNTTSGNTFEVGYVCRNITAYEYTRDAFTVNVTIRDSYNTTQTSEGGDIVRLPNNRPVISSVVISPSILYNFTNATCVVTATDADADDVLTYDYQWFVNGTNASGVYGLNASSSAANTMTIHFNGTGNYTNSSRLICQVLVNDGTASGDNSNMSTVTNSSQKVVQNSTNATLPLTAGVTTAATTVTFSNLSGENNINLTIPITTMVATPAGNFTGQVWVSNFTGTEAAFTNSNSSAFSGLAVVLGPAGTTFSPNITITFYYGALASTVQARIETALAAGYMYAIKCSDAEASCTRLPVAAYDTALDRINFSIGSFSTIGLYDDTPLGGGGGSSGSSISGSTGGSSFAVPVPAKAGCTESWGCTDWSECRYGLSTRTCTDANACGTAYDKPLVQKTCTAQPEAEKRPEAVPSGQQEGTGIEGGEGLPPAQKLPAGQAAGTAQKPAQPGGDIVSTIATLAVIVVVIGAVGAGAFVLLGGMKKRKGL